MIENILKRHIRLHTQSKNDTIDPLEDFNLQLQENEFMGKNSIQNTETGLIAIDSKHIIETDNSIKLSGDIKDICIYPSNKDTYNILKEIYPSKRILQIEFIYTQDIVLNMTSYKSVKDTYEILKKLNHTPKSDNELIDLAKHIIIPNKKLVIAHKMIGKTAFPNSKVKQYRLNTVYCYDLELIIKISYT